MGRLFRTLVGGVLIAATAAACGGSPGGGGGTPTPGGSGVLGGSPPAAPAITFADPWVLSTEGIGPYRLGAHMTDLTAAGLLGSSTPINAAECPDLLSVGATGMYEGTLLLVVRHTRLVQIGTAGGDGPVTSTEGVKVGDTLESAQATYGSSGTMHTGAAGLPGLVVPAGDRVLLFSGHPIRPGIGWYAAGYTDYTQSTFLSGDDC